MPVEEHGSGKTFEKESGNEHDEREDGGDERTSGRGSRIAELVCQDLYAELEVRPGDEEAKGFAGEESDMTQEVTPYQKIALMPVSHYLRGWTDN